MLLPFFTCLSLYQQPHKTIIMKRLSSSLLPFKKLLLVVIVLLAMASRRKGTLYAFSFMSMMRNRQQLDKSNSNKMFVGLFKLAAMTEHDDSTSTTSSSLHQPSSSSEEEDHARLSSSIRHLTTAAATTATTIETTTTLSSSALSVWETWCVQNMHNMYRQALLMKCPFFRRRASDLLDSLDQVLRFLIICRHKSLSPPVDMMMGPPPSWRLMSSKDDDVVTVNAGSRSSSSMATNNHHHNSPKLMHLSMLERMDIIRHDWRVDTGKGYYITARLNTSLYRDDCTFDGPDPDMPVRGLHKYINAASQLFHVKSSCAQLLQLQQQEIVLNPNKNNNEAISTTAIVAHWKIHGTLRLPWKPQLPTWTGSTTYHFDDNGLIYKHVETWDMSVMQAFMQTLAPNLARFIWKNTTNNNNNQEEEKVKEGGASSSS